VRVGIVGLGLIGASLGGALRKSSHVSGFDADPTHADTALHRGFVDQIVPTLEDCVSPADVVVLATPLSATLALIPEAAEAMSHGAILTDACSVKIPVVEAMERLPARVRAVGGHPIAGKESSGPDAADPQIFAGAGYAVVPTERSDQAAVERIDRMAREIGSRPVHVSAAEHDRTVARTSHLPQVLASALAVSTKDCDPSLVGPGLRGMTRLAGSDPDLWAGILIANRSQVAPILRSMSAAMDSWAEAVEAEDGDWIRVQMRTGQKIISR